jgi:hypothetical protein
LHFELLVQQAPAPLPVWTMEPMQRVMALWSRQSASQGLLALLLLQLLHAHEQVCQPPLLPGHATMLLPPPPLLAQGSLE